MNATRSASTAYYAVSHTSSGCSTLLWWLETGKGKCSSVASSTVVGHLIEGEEWFSVEFREQDPSVQLDLYSVSRGSGILGKVG